MCNLNTQKWKSSHNLLNLMLSQMYMTYFLQMNKYFLKNRGGSFKADASQCADVDVMQTHV